MHFEGTTITASESSNALSRSNTEEVQKYVNIFYNKYTYQLIIYIYVIFIVIK